MTLERCVSPREAPNPQLNGIDQALSQGCRLHGFRSGGGLRVVRLELNRKLTGYGEHPSADEALVYAAEDFLAGGRDYHEVYGKLHPHYLTGSYEVTSPLDGWLLQGNTLDAYRTDKGTIRVELTGLREVSPPQKILDQAKALRRPVIWENRGYVYEISCNPRLFDNIRDEGYRTRVVDIPKGKVRLYAWMYYYTKTGEGGNFNEALDRAFEAQEREKRPRR